MPDPSPAEPEPFRCEVSRERDAVRVRPIGELDVATAPILETQIAQLRDAGDRRIMLDLRGLQFIDSTGLHLILHHDTQARRDGYTLTLLPGSPAIQRVFDLAGLTTRLPFANT
jgi:anti-sigma B factor antagonist